MPLLRELQTASGWRLEVKHNARLRSLYLSAIHRCSVITVSASVQANHSLTTRLNQFGRALSPTFSWTAIRVFRFLEEGQPLLLHVHPRDDVPLSCEVSLGAHVRGELWTSGLLEGYGARLRPSWVQWDGDRLYGGTMSPREGVTYNAYRPHCPCAGRASPAWWSSFRWWGGPTPPERLPASWRQPHSYVSRYQMTADDPHE